MALQAPTETYTVTAGGGTKQFDLANYKFGYIVYADGGEVTIAADMNFDVTGTPTKNDVFLIFHAGGIVSDTAGGKAVNYFGTDMSDEVAFSPGLVIATYDEDNTSWNVSFSPTFSASSAILDGALIKEGTIANDLITDGTIGLVKLASLTARGYMVRAGASGVVEEFNAVTSGQLVGGDGTDVKSMPVTGDITVAHSAGNLVTTIGAGKVTQAMLAYTPAEYLEATLSITSAQVLALNGTPQTIVASPGAGYYIEVISASSYVSFNSAAYATNTTLQLICTGADVAQVQDTASLITTITKATKFQQVTAATAGQTQIIPNTALQVKVATGNPAAGDSVVRVSVIYRIVATS